ncbi:MAG TPA: beta-galactosidase, partial [Bacillales bacterium]
YPELDYFKWAEHLDVVSWDNYPSNDAPISETAMKHDLMRGLKEGQPFMLMEQTPSQQNWQPYNGLKRPGVMRLWSYQAVARGADTVMFFQLRRSIGACEKFHGAVIEHAGHENTRVFRECAQLGAELNKLGDCLLGSRIDAKVAIVFDWDNWWAIELSSGPSIDLKYVNEISKYYRAFYDLNIQVDIIGVQDDLEKYEVVIAPVLYMVKSGYADKIERFVENGGTFLTTFFSGIVNEKDLVVTGGYPGELRGVLGIWAEEIDALPPNKNNEIVMREQLGELHGTYQCGLLCDLIHSEGAEVLATYGKDFYKDRPVFTKNRYGHGEAFYMASSPESEFLTQLTGWLCREKGITPVMETPLGVEATRRVKDGKSYTFLLNHTEEPQSVHTGPNKFKDLLSDEVIIESAPIPPKGVMILEKK